MTPTGLLGYRVVVGVGDSVSSRHAFRWATRRAESTG